jgi:hypothetical protein
MHENPAMIFSDHSQFVNNNPTMVDLQSIVDGFGQGGACGICGHAVERRIGRGIEGERP